MVNIDVKSDLDSKLLEILQIVYDMVKFAEVKNGAVLALSGGSIGTILAFLGSSIKIHKAWNLGLSISVFFLCLSSLICIFSFLPQIYIARIFTPYKKEISNDDNYYFFGHLCKYKPENLVKSMSQRYYEGINMSSGQKNRCLDLAEQVIENSKIAMNKLQLFKLATWSIFMAALLVFIVAAVVYIFNF